MRTIDVEWLKVNWRDELKCINPFLRGRGGVVFISGSPASACNTFIKLIRTEFAHDCGNICVQFDPSDETTHYSSDMIVKLEQKLGVTPAPVGHLSVASNVNAGRDATISGININFDAGPFDKAEEKLRRTTGIVRQCENVISQQNVAIILNNWHNVPSVDVNWFWKDLWNDGIEAFIGEGLLLLCVQETEDGEFRHMDSLPQPDCLIRLPSRFEGKSLIHALEDIAKLLGSVTGEDTEVSQARAQSLLIAWNSQPAMVHCSLGLQRLGLQSR